MPLVKCKECVDSGWLLHITMPNGQQGIIDVKQEHQIPKGSLKTYLTCECEIGSTQIKGFPSDGIDS